MFFDRKTSNSSKVHHLEPNLYRPSTDIVEAMNTLIKERHNHNESCIIVKSSRRKQKLEIYLTNEGRGSAFFSMDLGHNLGSNVGKDFGLMLRGKDLTKQTLLSNLSTYTLQWYTRTLRKHMDLIEYKIVGDMQTILLPFSFQFKAKAGNLITTGQSINYQPFSNLQFRQWLESSCHSIHIDLRHTSG